MKKRKKLQNQQIILNRDISIKFYLNFLTFSSLNSFRLKYYYLYLKYSSLFKFLNFYLVNSFYLNFFLMKLVSSSFIYINFFSFNESFLLQKFIDSKNSYNDYLQYIRVFSTKLVKNKLLHNDYLNKYSCYVSNSKDNLSTSSAITYSNHTLNIVNEDIFAKNNIYIYLSNLQKFLAYINMVNVLLYYKFIMNLNIKNINNKFF